LIVHAGNAPQTARISLTFLDKNGTAKAPHPPYSPDLAPFDFFLSGHAKQLLRGAGFPDQDSLFDAIMRIVPGLEKVLLNDVFLFWMDRLQSCATAHGGDIEETKFSKMDCDVNHPVMRC
jgi:hypothetical protein